MKIRQPQLEHGAEVTFEFNGRALTALEGENLLAALWHHGIRSLGEGRQAEIPRTGYCLIGHCLGCRVRIGTEPSARACLATVQAGQIVRSEFKE